MRKLIGIILVGLICSISYGQSTAPNWTLQDCSAANHTLYTYLDSQEVVVMEFVMGCSSCTDAGSLLMNLKNEYDVSHPGKVNFFLMDYFPSNDCTDVTATWSSHNFDALFSGCWNEKDFYYPTLYPMPAIVIAAGNYHTVIYNDLSWQNSDTTLIKQAIDQFFVTVGVENNSKKNDVSIYPNPVENVLTIDISGIVPGEFEGIEVYDANGKQMKLVYNANNQIIPLTTSYFVPGSYTLVITTKSGLIRKNFIRL